MNDLAEQFAALYWVLKNDDPFKRKDESYPNHYAGQFFIGIVSDVTFNYTKFWSYNKLYD